jgi:predicted nucleic acid-binding Zn ribbon protein
MTSEVLRKCPDCNDDKLKRLFGSGGAVIFKGSGFYQTDYKNKKPDQKKTND